MSMNINSVGRSDDNHPKFEEVRASDDHLDPQINNI